MKLKLIIFFILLSGILHAASTPTDFFKALISESDDLRNYVDPTELARSERLGITYTGVKNKFMLANDIQPNVKEEIRKGNFTYEVHETLLEDNYSLVYFVIPQLNDSLRFYFYNGKFTSATSYLTKNWQTKESKYFKFKISEPKYFNDYCIEKLDEFVDSLIEKLDLSLFDYQVLTTKKLTYIFCTDEKVVGKITGIRSKGQAFLAFDEVITAYPTHYHEVAHLLINLKLKKLGLFTLPFMQEGFAVAVGGRGGMAPRVVTDIGYYLQKTNFLTYNSILTLNSFNNEDPSSSYAVAGLYNKFLITELGIERYLELYKKFTGDLETVKNIKINELDLPNLYNFEQFLVGYNSDKDMKFYIQKLNEKDYKLSGIEIVSSQNKSTYHFFTYGPISTFISLDKNKILNYKSRVYNEITKKKIVDANYLCLVDSNSIRIYNYINDELIFYYDKNFSFDHMPVPIPNKKKFEALVIEIKGSFFKNYGIKW